MAVDLAGLHQLELAVAKEFGTDAWVGLGAGAAPPPTIFMDHGCAEASHR